MTKKPIKKPGRPSAAEGQREQLLAVAVQLFSEQGIAATPLSRIARQARVTPAMVNYYFGNKAGLVQAVVDERILVLMQPLSRAAAALADEQDPGRSLKTLAARLISTVAATPWLPPLWVKEVLADNGQLRALLVEKLAPHFAGGIAALVRKGQQQGVINPALDARLLPISLIGLTVFALASRSLWSQLPGNDDIDTDTLVSHVLALLDAGLSAGGGKGTAVETGS